MVVTNAFLMNAYHYGLGRHAFYVGPRKFEDMLKWLWAGEPTNLSAVYLVRLSIAIFLLRIIPPKKVYRWIIYGSIVFLTISDVYVLFMFLFQCRPLQKVWRPEISGSCISSELLASAIWLYQGPSILSMSADSFVSVS